MNRGLAALQLAAFLAVFPLSAQEPPPLPPPAGETSPQSEEPPAEAAADPAAVQEQPPIPEPAPPTAPDESVDTQRPTPAESDEPPATLAAAPPERGGRGDRSDPFPTVNIYLPEGEFDLRLRKLIRNVLFEGQIEYNFVDGDVSTYLRYKYYARRFTYKLSVFDSIEFRSPESSNLDFDRIRGALLLFDIPRGPDHRFIVLLENDDLAFGDTSRPDHDKNDMFVKVAFQYGTPFDERLNGIAGEWRGRVTPMLTAHRDVGPQNLGFALAVAHSDDAIGSDFDYTRVEGEAVKRWDLGNNAVLVNRLHAGTILGETRIDPPPVDPDDPDAEVPEQVELYSVPRSEFFKIGGRGYLLAVDSKIRGSEQVHLTNEYFYPIFRGRDSRRLGIRWNDFYAIVYAGAGAIGFDRSALTDTDNLIIDGGLGFEAAVRVRNYDLILSAVYAQTLSAPAALEGDELLLSVRTRR